MESFENFFNEKLENFCKLVKSKNNDEINRNIEGLKLIYKIGGMKLFINSTDNDIMITTLKYIY